MHDLIDACAARRNGRCASQLVADPRGESVSSNSTLKGLVGVSLTKLLMSFVCWFCLVRALASDIAVVSSKAWRSIALGKALMFLLSSSLLSSAAKICFVALHFWYTASVDLHKLCGPFPPGLWRRP